MNSQIKLSILIATRKFNQDANAYSFIEKLNQNGIDFEIIFAEGDNPSKQRNMLSKHAQGDFILFLDDDSIPKRNLLACYLNTIREHPELKICGGPSVLVENDMYFTNPSILFFSSAFGIGPVRSRYNPVGKKRNASEKELILCNMLIRKDFFLKTSGFDQNLYPGEENKFLKSIHANTTIIYDPDAIVFRKPRETIKLFLQQMFYYGNGRAKHLQLSGPFEYLFLIPMFFTIYIILLVYLINVSVVFVTPIVLHVFLSLMAIVKNKRLKLTYRQILITPVLFLMGHFYYGFGLIIGILKYRILKMLFISSRPPQKINIHIVKNFTKIPT
ncbi:MAG: glycosyltransferase family 2 protein [Bacteriovorax sp.]|nr:glycosyltransferase family 2 protein [Bacteriovorax sp.]